MPAASAKTAASVTQRRANILTVHANRDNIALRSSLFIGEVNSPGRPDYTSRDWCTAAAMKEANSGCGSNGRDLSSG